LEALHTAANVLFNVSAKLGPPIPLLNTPHSAIGATVGNMVRLVFLLQKQQPESGGDHKE
jgi:hypothetical protein